MIAVAVLLILDEPSPHFVCQRRLSFVFCAFDVVVLIGVLDVRNGMLFVVADAVGAVGVDSVFDFSDDIFDSLLQRISTRSARSSMTPCRHKASSYRNVGVEVAVIVMDEFSYFADFAVNVWVYTSIT